MGYNITTGRFNYPLQANIPPPTGWTGAEYLWPNVNATRYNGQTLFLGETQPPLALAPLKHGYWSAGGGRGF